MCIISTNTHIKVITEAIAIFKCQLLYKILAVILLKKLPPDRFLFISVTVEKHRLWLILRQISFQNRFLPKVDSWFENLYRYTLRNPKSNTANHAEDSHMRPTHRTWTGLFWAGANVRQYRPPAAIDPSPFWDCSLYTIITSQLEASVSGNQLTSPNLSETGIGSTLTFYGQRLLMAF